MCEPTTLLAAATLATGAVGAVGQYQAGQFQEAVANQNAKVQEMQATDALQRGADEETRQRKRVRQLLGQQRVAMGANNVVLSSGSPLDILADTARLGEEDAITIRNNARREAWGYRVGAQSSRAQGRVSALEGRYGAASTLLTAGTSAYGTWKGIG